MLRRDGLGWGLLAYQAVATWLAAGSGANSMCQCDKSACGLVAVQLPSKGSHAAAHFWHPAEPDHTNTTTAAAAAAPCCVLAHPLPPPRPAGQGSFRDGGDGSDCYIKVPVGTIIRRKGAEVRGQPGGGLKVCVWLGCVRVGGWVGCHGPAVVVAQCFSVG